MIRAAFLAALLALAPCPAPAWQMPIDVTRALAVFDQPVEQCRKDCRVSPAGFVLVQHFEGLEPFPRPDPLGILTVCHGHLVRKGERWDKPCIGELARRTLEKDLAEHQAAVNRAVTAPLWPLQFDSLTSFRFNVGGGQKGVKDGLEHLKADGRPSTLLRLVNAARHDLAPEQFQYWCSGTDKRTGKRKKLPGLERRRFAEAEMYRQAKP